MFTSTFTRRIFWTAEAIVLVGSLGLTAWLSRASEWQPLTLVALLAALTLTGQWFTFEVRGKQLSADTTTLIYMDNASASETSTINPGVSVDVTLPFQLSTGDSIKYLELHDSAFSGGVKVSVG